MLFFLTETVLTKDAGNAVGLRVLCDPPVSVRAQTLSDDFIRLPP